jgi:hypothetical protein
LFGENKSRDEPGQRNDRKGLDPYFEELVKDFFILIGWEEGLFPEAAAKLVDVVDTQEEDLHSFKG